MKSSKHSIRARAQYIAQQLAVHNRSGEYTLEQKIDATKEIAQLHGGKLSDCGKFEGNPNRNSPSTDMRFRIR